jgi:hypothetical protein
MRANRRSPRDLAPLRWSLAACVFAGGCCAGGAAAGGPRPAAPAQAAPAPASPQATATPAPAAPPTAAPAGPAAAAVGPVVGSLGGCRMFPPDNPWNQDVSRLPLHPRSASYIAHMNPLKGLHPDWGAMRDGYGIPFSSGAGAPPQPMTWTNGWGADESDPRPCPNGGGKFCYPIPLTAPIEGLPSAPADDDRHVLYVDTTGAPGHCTLYELYQAQRPSGSSGWVAGNGAIFHLDSNALRPDGWTSGDAAGLPILPGLVRLSEIQAGEIRHALRFTVQRTARAYIHPATHQAGHGDDGFPPMGLRVRLKASFDTSGFSPPVQVILKAMKTYGMILADNGSDWFVTGESNDGWLPLMDRLVGELRRVHGTDFEVVDTGPILTTER